jgi:hypothetical protein
MNNYEFLSMQFYPIAIRATKTITGFRVREVHK